MPAHVLEGCRVTIVGAGPAGLMAADAACAAGAQVDVYDAMGSPGRKFLLAGKGGLNLTHSEPLIPFTGRYGIRRATVARWLHAWGAQDVRDWAAGLGVATFIGSSGRVFPQDMKAAPLLRAWLRRLREAGVVFHVRQRWLGWGEGGALRFATADGEHLVAASAVVLALGGASWPRLGSDGAWVPTLRALGVDIAPLQPANGGFNVAWSEYLRERHAGKALKSVVAHWTDRAGVTRARQGEFVITAYGIEGSLVYAIGAELREQLVEHGAASLHVDLVPGYTEAVLAARLAGRGKHSMGNWLRRRAHLDALKVALVFELIDKAVLTDPVALAAQLKALPLRLLAPRSLAETISTAGGVRLEALNAELMLTTRPGVFVAGEMLDWEAPTGGYLLTGCFASGRIAGAGAARWAAIQAQSA
ncbi:MAG: TIGR03862 family flavoprotein [Rhodanobacter sp.]